MKESLHNVRILAVLIFLLFMFMLGVVLNVNSGSVNIRPVEIFKIIFSGPKTEGMEASVIWKLRLPRLLAAALFGGALAVSGFLLQTFFRNPIAGPFVLGISSGSKLFVGFTMIVLLQHMNTVPLYAVVVAAFAGSITAMSFVLVFARKVQNMSMLLVIGIMIGYICSALTDFFVTFAKEADIANLHSWSLGSFSGISWRNLGIASLITLITMIVIIFLSKPIGAYQLGEGYAQSMGINIKAFRVLLIFLSSVLSAVVTAFAGPISFIGIAVPHVTKLLVKTARPLIVIPMSFLCGAVFCMFCDLIARTAFSPTELNIGTVTAALGAPVVIWLILFRRKER